MFRPLKVVTLAFLVFFAASSLFAHTQPKAALPALLLSVFVGFGSGQYYCGTDGTKFVLYDVGGLGMTALGAIMLASNDLDQSFTGISFLLAGAGTFLVSRIWQIFDVFWAVDEARKAGRIAEVVPVVDVDIQRASFELGFSLKY